MKKAYRLSPSIPILGILLGLLGAGCVHTDRGQATAEPVKKSGAFSITLHCAPGDQIDEEFEAGFEPYPASHDFVEVAETEPAKALAENPAARDADMECNALLENFREGSKWLTLQARYERGSRRL